MILLIHSIASTVIMGVFITTALVTGHVSGTAIIASIVLGIVLGFPAARLIAKKLDEG